MGDLSYIVNVEGAIYKGDKWLIVKRSEKEEHAPGLLSMVGGKVETTVTQNNVLEETVIREITEEVGIKVEDALHYIESKSFVLANGQTVIDIVFLCKYKSGEPKPISTDEVSNVYWMSTEDILENKHSPIWLKIGIEKAEKVRQKIESSIQKEL